MPLSLLAVQQIRHTWIAKQVDESNEQYWARVETLAGSRKQGIVCRRGGGSDLGFIAVDSDTPPDKPRVFEFFGAPWEWQAEEVCELLQLENWQHVSTITRQRKNGQALWLVRAKPPENSNHQKSWTFSVEDTVGDHLCDIFVNLAPPSKPTKPMERAVATAPRKSWANDARHFTSKDGSKILLQQHGSSEASHHGPAVRKSTSYRAEPFPAN